MEKEISKEELENFTKNGVTIIDVRSKQEYEEGHLNGAILIPEYEIKEKIKNIVENKNEKILVYCSSGIRSKQAQEELINLGYKNVYNLKDGIVCYWDFLFAMLKYVWQNVKQNMEEIWIVDKNTLEILVL